MNIKELISSIIEKEKENEELKLKLSEAIEAFNYINNMIEKSKIDSISTFLEPKEYLKIEISNHEDSLSLINTELNSLKNELIKYDKSTGEDINDLIDGIHEEQIIYSKNKHIENLKIMTKNIYDKVNQIEDIIKIKEIINNYKTNDTFSILEESPEEVSKNHYENLSEIPPLFENNISNDFILNKNLELSKYTLNNKMGYSLKDFGAKYKNEILQVFNHYEENLDKTINYFQRVHGLCPGTKIEPLSFKNSCYDIFKKPIGLSVFFNGKKIEANSLKELLLKTIERIGVPTIFKKCSDVFNATFKISKNKPALMENYILKTINHENYYIFIGGMSKIYIKEIINRIKTKLYMSNLIIESH